MMTFVAAMLVLVLMVSLYLYVSGVFNRSHLGAFRFIFYLLVVLFALTVGIGLMQHPYEGYDQTAVMP